jgi:hypothetical protein
MFTVPAEAKKGKVPLMTQEDESPEPKRPWWDSDMPITNPWVDIAPPCPKCGNQDCWLWHPTGTLRWYCHICKRRFDPVKKRKESKTRAALVRRDSAKFPALGKELAELGEN